MRVEIFNVELGQCVMIHCPNGQKIMIDAGHNTSQSWYPSVHFSGQHIERLIVSNFDEDHMSDFVDVLKYCKIRTIYRNATVDSNRLLAMKTLLGMGPGIKHVYDWLKMVEGPSRTTILPADLNGVDLLHFANPYGVFTDTNNLSFVTFARYGGFSILFPGDLEVAGWKELLKQQGFQDALRKVNILVASHHGRENGCCEEAFNFCKPQAVIISDGGKQHATQETCNWYANRTTGCKTISNTDRKVLTTRSDGHITLAVDQNGTWRIATSGETKALQVRA